MDNDINENNILFLSEEASQYLDEYINNDKDIYNSKPYSNNRTIQLPNDNLDNIKYGIDDLNKVIADKNNIIYTQKEKINSLTLLVENLKRNTKNLHEKTSQQDKAKIQINLLNKRILEIENERNFIKKEYM